MRRVGRGAFWDIGGSALFISCLSIGWSRERRESARAAARHAGTAVDRRSAARACQLLGAGDAGRRSGPESCDGAWEGGCERAARGAGPGVAHGPGPHGRRCPGLPPAAVLSCAGRCRSWFREACGRMRASSSAGPRRGGVLVPERWTLE